MDSDEVSTDVQRIVEIHKRTVSSEDPKLERIKFRMHRSTSIDSSSSSDMMLPTGSGSTTRLVGILVHVNGRNGVFH